MSGFGSHHAMKFKFNYDDMVKVRPEVSPELRPCAIAWVVGVFETRAGSYFDKFPDGIIYTIEFEDGSAVEVHELDIEPNTT
jgi:hypothetical protein